MRHTWLAMVVCMALGAVMFALYVDGGGTTDVSAARKPTATPGGDCIRPNKHFCPRTSTPTVTPTETATPTASATSTDTPEPTNAPTETPVPTDTPEPTNAPTETPVPTDTPTVTATNTATATRTPLPARTFVGLSYGDTAICAPSSSPISVSAALGQIEPSNSPTGTLTFVLRNGDSSQPVIYTNVVNVNGIGTYDVLTDGDNPGGYRPQVSGQYNWVVTYSGDTYNLPTTSYASQGVPDC